MVGASAATERSGRGRSPEPPAWGDEGAGEAAPVRFDDGGAGAGAVADDRRARFPRPEARGWRWRRRNGAAPTDGCRARFPLFAGKSPGKRVVTRRPRPLRSAGERRGRATMARATKKTASLRAGAAAAAGGGAGLRRSLPPHGSGGVGDPRTERRKPGVGRRTVGPVRNPTWHLAPYGAGYGRRNSTVSRAPGGSVAHPRGQSAALSPGASASDPCRMTRPTIRSSSAAGRGEYSGCCSPVPGRPHACRFRLPPRRSGGVAVPPESGSRARLPPRPSGGGDRHFRTRSSPAAPGERLDSLGSASKCATRRSSPRSRRTRRERQRRRRETGGGEPRAAACR